MTVTAANVLFSESSQTTDEVREYSLHYQVLTNDRNDGPVIARAALPSFGAGYSYGNETDPFAFCVGYGAIRPSVAPDDSLKSWMCEVRYSTRPRENCTTSQSDSPLDKPPHIRIHGLRLTKPVPDKDLNNAAIVNTAGRPFDDLSMDDSALALSIVINQASVDLVTLDDFTDAVNDAAFYGLGARKWKMEPPEIELKYYGSCDIYYTVGYEFHSATDEWTLRPANVGLENINGDLPIDGQGNAFVGIAPLDAAGVFLPKGDPNIVFFNGAGANPAPFEVYPEKDFGQLGIPTDLP